MSGAGVRFRRKRMWDESGDPCEHNENGAASLVLFAECLQAYVDSGTRKRKGRREAGPLSPDVPQARQYFATTGPLPAQLKV